MSSAIVAMSLTLAANAFGLGHDDAVVQPS